MFRALRSVVGNALAYLKTGEAPPNTPERIKKQVEDTNHLSSKKFFIVFSSMAALGFFYYSSVGLLFVMPTIPPEIIAAYTTIFTKTTEILAVIIATYLGCQSVVDFKFQNNSSTENITENKTLNEKSEVKIDEHTEYTFNSNVKEDDYEL